MSDETKAIELIPGGWTNPDRDKKCGPTDPTLAVLDPVHIGGCKTCRSVIIEMLKARHPEPPKPKPDDQLKFEWHKK